MTTERGILYSDEMVRAMLTGRKTVTVQNSRTIEPKRNTVLSMAIPI